MSEVIANTMSPSLSIGELLDGIDGVAKMDTTTSRLQPVDITVNSEKIKSSALFIALPGLKTDGRKYVDQAIAKGALSVLYEAAKAPKNCSALAAAGQAVAVDNLAQQLSQIASRFFGEPAHRLNVVGITGTNGKTTCAYLISQAMHLLGERSAVMGTIGTGLVGQLTESDLTTKDAIETQRTLKAIADQGATAVCMEVSSHGLEQHRVDGVNFNVAVFTNLSQDHLDYHGTMDAYGEVKKKLFRFSGLRGIVVNSDDQLGREILQQSTNCSVISYGKTDADIVPLNLKISPSGISFKVRWQDQVHQYHSTLIGEVNLPNLLATIATLLLLGYSPEEIAKVFPELVAPPGRMERMSQSSGDPLVVVDYSHTPDSLERALRSLQQQCKGDLWVVFGCGGDRDQSKRSLMGAAAANIADRIILTNDNPRTESPLTIAKQAATGIESVGKNIPFEIILDRKKAIETAVKSAGHNDVVLIAGKGHERTQDMGVEKLPFSDREVVRHILGDEM